MSFKKMISVGLVSLIFVGVFCNNDDPTSPPVTGTAVSYGNVSIQLSQATNDNEAHTNISAAICDGPSPPLYIFEEVMSSGPCKLMKVVTPNWDCPTGYKCVKGDSCMIEPTKINVGNITVKGLKTNDGLVDITMEPNRTFVYLMGSVPLVYPPCSEGDTITVSAAGKDTVAAFTIKTRGITPLVVLTEDNIPCEAGKDVTIQWEPPKIAGVSKIYVRINVSYHGTDKGEIQAECDDNGSLTIPGDMLDELIEWGVNGWPILDITRKSVGYNEDVKASVTVECKLSLNLSIPGVTSCANENDTICPAGTTCQALRCQ
jgi:hypothetical protein